MLAPCSRRRSRSWRTLYLVSRIVRRTCKIYCLYILERVCPVFKERVRILAPVPGSGIMQFQFLIYWKTRRNFSMVRFLTLYVVTAMKSNNSLKKHLLPIFFFVLTANILSSF